MANIMRRGPLFGGERSLTALQRNMDQLFDELFRWSENMWPLVEGNDQGGISVDVVERDKDILIKANVPGFDQKDINIEVSEDNIILSGKHEEEVKEEGERYLLKERRQAAFERVIPLGVKTVPDKVKAVLKNGVLEIVLPKAEPTQKKAVKIKVE
jgi:HSP20 family protein